MGIIYTQIHFKNIDLKKPMWYVLKGGIMQFVVNIPDENIPKIRKLMEDVGADDFATLFNKALTRLMIATEAAKKATVRRSGEIFEPETRPVVS